MLGQDNFGDFGRRRKSKKRRKTSRKRKTAHQARFSRASKQCKGLKKSEFRSCMREELSPALGRRRRRRHRR